MKAITLYQPYASLTATTVIKAGMRSEIKAKTFETRGWATSYRGKLAIHAGKKPVLPWFQREVDTAVRLKIIETVGNPVLLPRGAVISTGELVECYLIGRDAGGTFIAKKSETTGEYVKYAYIRDEDELMFGDWTPGRFAWELVDMKKLPEPIAVRGMQGLWEWDEVGLR